MPVNIDVKTKLVINGKEYSSPDELPPEMRKVYDLALANRGSSPQIQITGSSKVTFNGKTFDNREAMPDDARQSYDRAMEAIDSNQDGIPDSLQAGENAVLSSAGTSTPMSPLPAQPSPISPDRPGQGKAILCAVVILIVFLAVALFYFGFIR